MQPSLNVEGVEVASCKRCGNETRLPKGKTAQRRLLGLCEGCFKEERMHRRMHRMIESIPGLYGDLPFTYYPINVEEGSGRNDPWV